MSHLRLRSGRSHAVPRGGDSRLRCCVCRVCRFAGAIVTLAPQDIATFSTNRTAIAFTVAATPFSATSVRLHTRMRTTYTTSGNRFSHSGNVCARAISHAPQPPPRHRRSACTTCRSVLADAARRRSDILIFTINPPSSQPPFSFIDDIFDATAAAPTPPLMRDALSTRHQRYHRCRNHVMPVRRFAMLLPRHARYTR